MHINSFNIISHLQLKSYCKFIKKRKLVNSFLIFLEFLLKGWKFSFFCVIMRISIGKWREAIMIELLAPAGSMDALRAAVQNGANAVYLGCGTFNARQSAKNFTPDTLTEAVKY